MIIPNANQKSLKLRGGRFAPQWLYFDFYIHCRRQKKFPGRNLDPSFAAWNGLGAVMAIPWLVVILMIDHYVHFLTPLGHLLVNLGLPGDANKAWGYALIIVGIFSGLGVLALLFSGQYKIVMREFSIYDRSKHDLAPGIILALIWFAILGISGYASIQYMKRPSNILLWATLINICIFVAAEIGFRFWWRWWSQNERESE